MRRRPLVVCVSAPDTDLDNEQVKRNLERFPADFMFQLSAKEAAALRSQIATGSPQAVDYQRSASDRSQFATGSQKHRDPHFRPYAFFPSFVLFSNF